MTDISPPLLPPQWSSAYISYWSPMLGDDQITSGYCWFDYMRNVCRIDGLFNPWPVQQSGHRLWMSEIGDAGTGVSCKRRIAYSSSLTDGGPALCEQTLADELAPCHELLLSRSVLRDHDARHAGQERVLGEVADIWCFRRPGKGASTYYVRAGTGMLLRMVTGDPTRHASVRDFPGVATHAIAHWIFELPDSGK